jgi:hypothetical protein
MHTKKRPYLTLEPNKIPAYAGHLGPALLAEFARLFAHAEHSKGMLPSMKVQLRLHGNLLPSGGFKVKGDYLSKGIKKD